VAKPYRAPSPAPLTGVRYSVPDRRLASLFIKRSDSAPVIARRIGMAGGYSPGIGGSANFATALRAALLKDRPGAEIGVVRVEAISAANPADEVIFELSTSDGEHQCKAAAAELNKFDVAVIQYDPGNFGGTGGEQAMVVLNWIRVPTVLVVHNVPAGLTAPELSVLRTLGESADAVVTMSETARQRLIGQLGLPPRKIMVIQHGAHARPSATPQRIGFDRRPNILTWGLLSPGKGIETAIEAMRGLSQLRPLPHYMVAGPTHPRELAQDGERYRNSLVAKVSELGLADSVGISADYVGQAQLQAMIREADVVLLPYDSRDLAASAVLVEAIASRKPIVATRFSQAVELLDGEHGGVLVEPGDAKQMADAISRILANASYAEQLVAKASGLADALAWPTVAAQYRQLFDALLRRPGGSA
jgi:glycosyltransferase involved in cell wall biosynthesis